ncbi:MAG TPA: hypothetical protein VM889_07185 [Candidatus Thermoplasmatota archaeon]|nr:hypothetical protein [Candidatus Thermoplasmatota archaeon]
MGFSTTITVPTKDVKQFMNVLAHAGAVVLDTGERIHTDEGVSAEAYLNVLFLPRESSN